MRNNKVIKRFLKIMSTRIQRLQPGDRIKLSLSGEYYQVVKNDGIFLKTKNINNGYGRTFTLVTLANQNIEIEEHINFTRSSDRSREEEKKEVLQYRNSRYTKEKDLENIFRNITYKKKHSVLQYRGQSYVN